MTTRIDNGSVWSEGKLTPLSLLVDGEKISRFIDPENAGSFYCDKIVDAKGMWILPGGIDFHVHISEGAETFYPGTSCAAAGGITTVLDMAPFHACITVDQMLEKAAVGEAACVIDFGLIAGIVIENSDLEHLAELSKAGAAYFKVFQPAEPQVSTDTLWRAVQAAASTGLRLGLHAEDPSYFVSNLDAHDPLSFPHSRPAVAETSVVAQVIEMARAAGAPVHICHVSTGRTAELIAWAKAHGTDITCETPPHFLHLDESAFSVYGARAKTTPPIRKASDNLQLWEALKDGVIDAIACDHYTENLIPLPNDPQLIDSAAAGISGLEVSLPLMMNAVLNGRLSLNRFVEASATTPARLAGMLQSKGSISPGKDADFTVWDPDKEWKANRTGNFSRINTTPFAGWNLRGVVAQTWVRGEQVWNGESIQKEPGYGKWIKSMR
jgi:allantoinase